MLPTFFAHFPRQSNNFIHDYPNKHTPVVARLPTDCSTLAHMEGQRSIPNRGLRTAQDNFMDAYLAQSFVLYLLPNLLIQFRDAVSSNACFPEVLLMGIRFPHVHYQEIKTLCFHNKEFQGVSTSTCL